MRACLVEFAFDFCPVCVGGCNAGERMECCVRARPMPASLSRASCSRSRASARACSAARSARSSASASRAASRSCAVQSCTGERAGHDGNTPRAVKQNAHDNPSFVTSVDGAGEEENLSWFFSRKLTSLSSSTSLPRPSLTHSATPQSARGWRRAAGSGQRATEHPDLAHFGLAFRLEMDGGRIDGYGREGMRVGEQGCVEGGQVRIAPAQQRQEVRPADIAISATW